MAAEADFAPLLAPDSIGRLEADWESLSAQGESVDKQLKQLLQQRGRWSSSSARRRPIVRWPRSSWSSTWSARSSWRRSTPGASARRSASCSTKSATSTKSSASRRRSAKRRSTWRKLTGGKYKRIWTPLANDILLLDTEDGTSLPVEVLSRGTREQLFVSLRLALVAAFARRGIHLPMILDDVFVNFDAERTKIAVNVLREFARAGHQLLVFTCHEHVWRMFSEIKADARRIPDRFHRSEERVEVEPEPAVEMPQREPEPEPMAVEEPEVVEAPEVLEEETVEEALPEPEPAPVARHLDEVEYTWQDLPAQRPGAKARVNGRHPAESTVVPLRPWPAEPMIHRPDWW